MANKTLNTRLKLKYDVLANWQDTSVAGKGANLVLLQGEVAICQVPASSTAISGESARPQYLMKVGNGVSAFKDLPWVNAIAADVYDWAKAASRPTYAYGDSDLTGFGSAATKSDSYFDLAGAADAAESAAKAYTDEAIAGISGTDTQYQIVITGTTMKLQSKEKNASVWVDVTGQSWNLNTILKGSIASGNTGFVTGGDVYIELGKKQDVLTFDGTYSASTNKVATVSTVTSAVAGEAELREEADDALDTRIKAFEANGAHDVAALEGRVTTAEDDIDTLEGKVATIEGKPAYAITSTQISNWNNEVGAKAAVEAEEERATGVEAGLRTDVNAKVASVGSGSNAIAIGGTATAPTVGLKIDATTPGNVVFSQGANGLKASVEIPSATVTGVKSGEKVIALDGTELTSTLSIGYDSTNRKVQLKGINGALVSEFDASAFIKDGMIYGEKLIKATATSQQVTIKDVTKTVSGLTVGHMYLVLCFSDGAITPEYTMEAIDVHDLVDVYTAGDGLELNDNEFSVKKDASSESYLTVSSNGVKVSGIDSAISTAVNAEKALREAAETALGGRIDDVEGDLTQEIADRQAAITDEVTRADGAYLGKTAKAADADKLDGHDSTYFETAAHAEETYVEKVSGKGLSTEDYTTAEKNKLAGITAGATKVEASTTNGNIKINGTETNVFTEVAGTVHDANYKHITVATNSVSDGTTTCTLPTELKNPYTLTIGDKSYDGSAAVEVTADDIGAMAAETLDLATIATTGNVNDLIQTSGDLLIFDCGSSTTNI